MRWQLKQKKKHNKKRKIWFEAERDTHQKVCIGEACERVCWAQGWASFLGPAQQAPRASFPR